MFDRRCPLVLSTLVIAVLVTERAVVAQPSGETPRPRASVSTQSPEVGVDRCVTFRLRAAKATEVVVAGQWGGEPAAMTKGDSDVWSVTVGPMASGVWEYSFRVDGVQMIDPGNPAIKPMRQPRTSILHEWHLTDGNHSWPVWRIYLAELAPRLFR